nr:selenide, water dikinase SelD [Gammaproteobacteria bacterium]
MQNTAATVVKELVLVGGGHSHVAVLKRFGMRPLPGLRLTLITRDLHTPYSGMLPGYIAGHYEYDDCHIDLRKLARFARARLYHSPVEGLDLAEKQVHCRDRPPVRFDLLSFNIGSRPQTLDIPGADKYALPVKPIDRFLEGWGELIGRVLNSTAPFRIAVVGGGAGGVELALATQHRLRKELTDAGRSTGTLQHCLVTDTPEILPSHAPRTRAAFQKVLASRQISIFTNHRGSGIEPGRLHCEGGQTLEADAVLWVTHAGAPPWLAHAGLATDARGFLLVDDALRCVSHPEVFAAGDIATGQNHARPKAGVFAVRQGPPLAANLRCAALGKAPKPFTPQKNFLSLITTGDRYAIASRGGWSLQGAWVWRWKDWIDRRFMAKYNRLPVMEGGQSATIDPRLTSQATLREISAVAMRCGGCGAKVGSTTLSRVISRIQTRPHRDVLVGLQEPDDAAVLRVESGKVLVQSVDYFRAFVDDAYDFGRIAANHSLGDIFAMGAKAQSAQAIATVPYGTEAAVEEALYDMLRGALEILEDCGAALIGGHSSEGAELAFGLVVNGIAAPDALLRKGGMQPGNRLVLTKPLGTGTLFAADMRHAAKGRWIQAAIASMVQSNGNAADCVRRHGATACTDVTGFGLLGHLAEMTRPSGVDAVIDLELLPVLQGARETMRAGIFSSLQPQNVRLRRAVRNLEEAASHPHYALLFDPQTAGGLLASLPEKTAETCVTELRQLGYAQATLVGRVEPESNATAPIRLLTTSSVRPTSR